MGGADLGRRHQEFGVEPIKYDMQVDIQVVMSSRPLVMHMWGSR